MLFRSGFSIGGFILGEKASDVLVSGDHGSTFGGNPIVASGGCAVVDTMDENFLMQVREKGEYIVKELSKMKNIHDISGLGMMIGFKVKGIEAKEFLKRCLNRGLMVLTAKEKVRLLPPLNISEDDIKEGLDIIREEQQNN